jgi:hypothetical protein
MLCFFALLSHECLIYILKAFFNFFAFYCLNCITFFVTVTYISYLYFKIAMFKCSKI